MAGLQSTDTCIVNVNAADSIPANQAPTADAGADQIVNQGELVVSDEDPIAVIPMVSLLTTCGNKPAGWV